MKGQVVMKLRNIIGYSEKLLKGKRLNAMLISAAPPGAALFFRLGEAAVYSIMLYFGSIKPIELFTGKTAALYVIAFIFTALRYLITAPLIYAAAYRFTGYCSTNSRMKFTPLSRIIFNRRLYGKSLSALLCTKITAAFFMLPSIFFGYTAFSLISDAIANASSTSFFMAIHAAVMTLLSLGIWIYAKLSTICVPYLTVRFPEKRTPVIIAEAFRFMKGRRSTVFKLFFSCALQMLPIITIPFVLPKLYSALALCIDIFIKEDEYREGNCTECRYPKASHASKLSAWAKRRFTAAPDEAQAAGYGNNT